MSQQTKIQKEKWHWNNTTRNSDAGYAAAVKMNNVIYISGLVTNSISPQAIFTLAILLIPLSLIIFKVYYADSSIFKDHYTHYRR